LILVVNGGRNEKKTSNNNEVCLETSSIVGEAGESGDPPKGYLS
jgi:hypothetical protein